MNKSNELIDEEKKSTSVVEVSEKKFKSEKEIQLEKFEKAFGKRFNW